MMEPERREALQAMGVGLLSVGALLIVLAAGAVLYDETAGQVLAIMGVVAGVPGLGASMIAEMFGGAE